MENRWTIQIELLFLLSLDAGEMAWADMGGLVSESDQGA